MNPETISSCCPSNEENTLTPYVSECDCIQPCGCGDECACASEA
jgi:hypothetical protein